MWIVKKGQDFRNVRDLTGKEGELVGEFEREILHTLEIMGTKEKGSGEMEMEGGHLSLIFNSFLCMTSSCVI